MTSKEIVEMYLQEGSLKTIAAKAGVCPATVKKILVSNGIYPSIRSQSISELCKLGYSLQEISKITKVSKKAVLANVPYSKGRYRVEPRTENAIRIEKCRKKKQNTTEE